jgi:hypothetical protein
MESDGHKEIDAQGIADDCAFVEQCRVYYRADRAHANVDCVAMETSVGFDKFLLDYPVVRRNRFS